ncbi:hypothetical protein SD70_19615 [Gordoniibacillus kamchatkensis]|uniref:Uncharacterized protein n=1 Tax=Gordoniibacillus kamchatkensis TaxID=1590651 RepID=A0ABR5AGK5_9BACL|nr:hypothetical protein [Paenibacillus sp. VKM B-2647]KIL39492.1 hypothetical protein SD70_19615 [Paenibacillus sp. VKM B-2647]
MKLRGKYALLLTALAVLAGLSGCGTKDGSKQPAGTAAQQSGAGGSGEQAAADRGSTADRPSAASGEDLQSRKAKELVLLFVALLQMDKKPELALTEAEAAAIVPIVKAGKEKGELSAEERQKIVASLTAEQARFISDFRERAQAERKKLHKLTPEERAAMIEQFKKQRQQEESGMAPRDDGPDATAKSPADAPRGGVDGRSGERNLEQQLLDLLEAKAAHGRQQAQPKQ